MVAPGNHDVEGRHMCGNNDNKEGFLHIVVDLQPAAQFANLEIHIALRYHN